MNNIEYLVALSLEDAIAFICNTEAFGKMAATGILRAGDARFDIDAARANIAALRRSQPEGVPEGFVRTVPDPQMRTMCTAQAMGQQLAKLQEEGEMPTERMVEVAAQWLSESPLIQEPKLPPPAWMGLARHVLQAAFSAAEASKDKPTVDAHEKM